MSQLTPITSREYKLILNSSRFKQREEGSKQFWDLVEFLVKSNHGEIEPGKSSETWTTEKRKTWYLDTPTLSLSSKGFTLRVREEKGEYKITLKYRSSDQVLSADQDASSTSKNSRPKFEQDIVPPLESKFSRSNSIEYSSLPNLETISDLVAIFPSLGKLSIPDSTPIKRVNDFTANEVCLKATKRIKFTQNSPKVKACFSFWYLLGNDDEYPLISEFSFDYDIPEDISEDFQEFVKAANRFFENLQKFPDWLSSGKSTKTNFVFGL
jgi:hypothetical protein